MNITYDKAVDAIYFKRFDVEILDSEEIAPGVIYDYDKDDNVVGVEVYSLKNRTAEETKAIKFPFTEDEKAIFREFFLNVFA